MFEREVNPNAITQADIAAGIASYKEADTIHYPTKQADEGLRKYFPNLKPVIINCDNHSPDGTEEAFLNTETKVPKVYITTPLIPREKAITLRICSENVVSWE